MFQALGADASAFNRSNDVATLAEEPGIPGAPELYLIAHRKFSHIPERGFESDAVNGYIVQIDLHGRVAGSRGHQNFPSLLFPIDLPSIKVTMGNFPALLTANGSPAYFSGDRYHPPSFT